MSLIAGRGCRWPPRRDCVSPVRTVVGGGRDTHDGHENSPILVFFSNLLVEVHSTYHVKPGHVVPPRASELWIYSMVNSDEGAGGVAVRPLPGLRLTLEFSSVRLGLGSVPARPVDAPISPERID